MLEKITFIISLFLFWLICGVFYNANKYGWFSAVHPWALKSCKRAEEFLHDFTSTPSDFVLLYFSQWMECRWPDTPSDRRRMKVYYLSDYGILRTLMFISRERLLFGGFKGTSKEISSYPGPGRYWNIFRGCAEKLNIPQEQVSSVEELIRETNQFSYDLPELP